MILLPFCIFSFLLSFSPICSLLLFVAVFLFLFLIFGVLFKLIITYAARASHEIAHTLDVNPSRTKIARFLLHIRQPHDALACVCVRACVFVSVGSGACKTSGALHAVNCSCKIFCLL